MAVVYGTVRACGAKRNRKHFHRSCFGCGREKKTFACKITFLPPKERVDWPLATGVAFAAAFLEGAADFPSPNRPFFVAKKQKI